MATPDLCTASSSVASSDAPSDRISADSSNRTSITTHKEDGNSNPEADELKPAPQPDDHQPTAHFLRRSARRTTRPSYLSPCTAPPRAEAKKRLPSSAIMTAPARRNPKRKANEPSKLLNDLPADLLSEALKPLEPNEIEEWDGWVELESEPVSDRLPTSAQMHPSSSATGILQHHPARTGGWKREGAGALLSR